TSGVTVRFHASGGVTKLVAPIVDQRFWTLYEDVVRGRDGGIINSPILNGFLRLVRGHAPLKWVKPRAAHLVVAVEVFQRHRVEVVVPDPGIRTGRVRYLPTQ